MVGKRTLRSCFCAMGLRRFGAEDRGVAAIEFAMVLPIVVLLMLGCFEVPRYVLVYQRLARTSASVADLVAQADEPISSPQMADIFSAGKMLMQPYDVVTNGEIVVSSINNPAGAGVILTWQRSNGAVTTASKIGVEGAQGNAVKIPTALLPAADQEVLAAEVYFNYVPVFGTRIYQGSELYMVSYSRPRNKNLTTKPAALTPLP
ncbi:TadE/TadG family type IV pilus assembly protein [Dongia sedimenti]|uniref:Pilus assembly protein n=1 Tax=Dongia sedimenti TaxID=3064282 RepID=A0ABU0YQA2_9PROT|nr:pilus assembly protein [Rhodospirillaceae bacterium R-7]